jgi:hypothetical protein
MLAEPPQNGEYLVTAYVVAATILLGYWLKLLRSVRKPRPEQRDGLGADARRSGLR